MLRISQRCEYATRALIELALRADHRPAKIAEVAVARLVPRKFLGAILAQLRQAGVVDSVRGVQGGYRLARPARQITVGLIVRLVDGPLEIAGTPAPAGGGTPDGMSVLAEVRTQVCDAVAAVLERVTLADLVENERRRQAAVAGSYTI